MKKRIAILFAAKLFILAGAVLAQDNGEKVNVPLTDPSRPVRVHVSLLQGSITVRGTNSNVVTVETRPRTGQMREHERPLPPNAAGMHRLDLGGSAGLDITEEDNKVNIKTTSFGDHSDLLITVPHNASLELKTMTGGGIEADQVSGEIDADALNGPITLKNVSGSVVAHSLNGAILVSMDQVDPSKPLAFSTLNGDIDVTLPDNVKANVRMKTDNGEIYSDFDVKLDSGSHSARTDSGDRHNGAYRIRIDRTLRGTINGGGPEFQFTSMNGQIFIRKKK